MNMVIAIASGGAIGAVLRHLVNRLIPIWGGHDFPWATLSVNVLGSFIMGVLIALFAHHIHPSPETKAFLTVGVLGSFTTFSTFSLDTITLWERGLVLQSFGYIAASVMLSLCALFVGMTLIRYIGNTI